jgi:chromosome segregation ATPase
MLELQDRDVPSVVQVAEKVVGDVDALVGSMKELMSQHEVLRERFDRLECENQELRKSEESVRREGEERARAFVELRASYEALLTEADVRRHALQELRERHDALLRERSQMAEELDAVIRSLVADQEPVGLATPAAER